MTFDAMKQAGVDAERAYWDAAWAEQERLIAAAKADLTDALAVVDSQHVQHQTDVAQLAVADALIEDLKAQLAALQPRKPILGVALGDQLPATFAAFRGKFPQVTGQRIYHKPDQFPATYPTSLAKHLTGDAKAFVSFKPPISEMKNGMSSTWAKGMAQSCPEGTLLCFQHEPEQIAKGISAADFVAAQNRVLGDIGKTPALRTVCLMEYQFAKQGAAYLRGLDPAVVDVIACDFYTGRGNGRPVQQLCEPFFTVARTMFPNARLAIGELGVSKQSTVTDRGKWLADGLKYLYAAGIDTFYYQANIGGEADWALTDAEWAKALS